MSLEDDLRASVECNRDRVRDLERENAELRAILDAVPKPAAWNALQLENASMRKTLENLQTGIARWATNATREIRLTLPTPTAVAIGGFVPPEPRKEPA